jgi:hypothetical protein
MDGIEKESEFPAGNAAVGDAVWVKRVSGWDEGWIVSRVGLRNESGYNLAIEIKKGEETVGRSPFGRNEIRLFPVEAPEIPAGVKEYENLVLVRDPCNSEEARFHIMCVKCRGILWREEVSVYDIYVHGGDVLERDKGDLMDRTIVCDCQGQEYGFETL